MKGFTLDITLLDDTLFTQRAASEGTQTGLDFIPGAALLGAAARLLYDRLGDRAWDVFHSGKVRFGNGLPLIDGTPGYPIPLALHQAKGGEKGEDVYNFLVDGPEGARRIEGGRQPQQKRGSYLSLDMRERKIATALRMKTAIDPQTGRAEDAKLFGYAGIPAGARYRARITLDTDLPPELQSALENAFTGPVFLGRSRSAEYGRTHIERKPLTPAPAAGPLDSRRLVLWCLADMACIDAHGQLTSTPAPETLGLGTGHLDLAASFIRTRRYTPWNAKRGGYDSERLVISAGSVLVYELEQPLIPEQAARLQRGLGLYTAQGLGQVWANPPLLAQRRLALSEATPTRLAAPPRPDHPLIHWMERRLDNRRRTVELDKALPGLLKPLQDAYRSAAIWAGHGQITQVGPSSSQWSSVYEHARTHDNLAGLFDDANAICKSNMPGWSDPLGNGETFLDAFRRHQSEHAPDARTLQAIARALMDWVKTDANALKEDRA
ncbi:MAG: hypothetical protein PHI49_09800 [Halothiobacillaceae bacterium]|nr:hypothetical protein [Halothiobacillaceae bacterium]